MSISVLSYGGGVQSTTLAAMIALGALPPVHAVIHADTTHERQATYEYLRWFGPWLEERGVNFVTVQRQDGPTPLVDQWGGLAIPAYVDGKQKGGQVRRQCTDDWKIRPIREWFAGELKRLELKKAAGSVVLQLGISLDEFQRAKTSNVQWIVNQYPLLERRMTRAACVTWLQNNGLPVPAKSSCVFCPFHTKRAWADMKRAGGADWENAVAADESIRNHRIEKGKGQMFLTSQRIPLADIRIAEDFGAEQLQLFDDETPCDSGHCFV